MPKYSYFCKACAEPYELRMSVEEKERWVPRCPNCGGEGEQEMFGVAPDGGKRAKGGCGCSGGGCCG